MFILSGMIACGLLPLRRALVVLACANIGTAALVFVAAVDLHLPILLLVGVSGLLLAFKLFTKWRPGIGALLSIGLVFFGLDMMKHAFQPLSATNGLLGLARFFNHWPDLASFLGALMRSVVHSSAACAAITITINHGALLGEFPTMMLNLAIAAVAIGGLRWAPRWLARLSPPTPEEDLSRTIYLQAEALHSPETAPDLVALEQMRLIFVLTEYLEAVRGTAGKS
jgi:Na+/phosphate symporter